MATRLVIEWTRSSVRLALAEGRGTHTRIRTLHAQPVGDFGETAEALRTFLSTARVTPSELVLVVPREQVITRVVRFPTTEWGELTQMVELYVKAQLPYPWEQSVTDFCLLAQQEGFSTVAVVACQREVMDRQLAPLREAGLSPSLVTVSSWGVLGWCCRSVPADPAQEPRLVINVDETRTDLVLIAEERILSSRSVGQGVQDWTSSSSIPEFLSVEADRSRAAIRKELPGVDVRSLMLTGLGPLTQWNEEIAQRLGLSVAVVDARSPFHPPSPEAPGVSPGRKAKRMASARFRPTGSTRGHGREPVGLHEETSLPEVSFSPVVVGGVALSDPHELLNLSPPEMRAQVRHRRQVRDLTLVGVLLLLTLGLGSTLLALQIACQRQLESRLDHELGHIAPTARQIQEKDRSVHLVRSVLQQDRQLATTLAGVFRQTPPSVVLEGLTFERSRREMSLKGSAASTQDVLEYIKTLERVEGIQGVDLKYSAQRSAPSGERASFELLLRLSSSLRPRHRATAFGRGPVLAHRARGRDVAPHGAWYQGATGSPPARPVRRPGRAARGAPRQEVHG